MIRAATEYEILRIATLIEYHPTRDAKGVVHEINRKIAAMVIYDRWSYNGVEAHVYSAAPTGIMHREYLREVFSYPFVQCGRAVVVIITPGDAELSLRLSAALGFKEVYRLRDYWRPGIDMVVKEMRKEECKWCSDPQ